MDDKIFTARRKELGVWEVIEEIIYDDGRRSRPEVVETFRSATAADDAEKYAAKRNEES